MLFLRGARLAVAVPLFGGSPGQVEKAFFEVGKRWVLFRLWQYDQVETTWHLGLIQSKGFSNAAFPLVSLNSIADLAACNHEPKSRNVQTIFGDVDHQPPVSGRGLALENSVELLRRFQANMWRK